MHAADSGRPADRLQPQSLQSRWQLSRQSCGLQGVQEQGTSTGYTLLASRRLRAELKCSNQPPSLGLDCQNKCKDSVTTTAQATSSLLCVNFPLQAVVYYTDSLKSTDVQIQQASCLALKCLRVSDTHYTHTLSKHINIYRNTVFTTVGYMSVCFVCVFIRPQRV